MHCTSIGIQVYGITVPFALLRTLRSSGLDRLKQISIVRAAYPQLGLIDARDVVTLFNGAADHVEK